jgi:hypothetical protein
MPFPKDVARLCRDNASTIVGAVISLAAAILLFTRFSWRDGLSRDQSIYVYGGQRMAHGVPPYTSIFDPKTPITTLVSGVAASIGRATGTNQLIAIRYTFFIIALLMVMAMFVLALRLWQSVAGAVVAAVVLASFTLVASEALAGPEAKAPGVLAAILTMWLVIEKRWYWAAFAGAVAFLTWQPFVIYPVMVGVIALYDSIRERRWESLVRVIAGAVSPFVIVLTYFAITSGIGNFWDAAFKFPATGVQRDYFTITGRLHRIKWIVNHYYGFSGRLLWVGDLILIGLVILHLVRGRHDLRAAIRHPLVSIVFVTMLAELGYALYDFQGGPDVYPFLAYPALGFAGLIALVERSVRGITFRRLVSATALVAAACLFAASMVWFHDIAFKHRALRSERADACAINRIIGDGSQGGLWAMGDPIPLVLTDRTNPDRFIYLSESVDRWKVNHTPGGFNGWTRQVQAANPAVIVVQQWKGPYESQMVDWIRSQGYHLSYAGKWHLYLRPATVERAYQAGVRLTSKPTPFAAGLDGRQLPAGCT